MKTKMKLIKRINEASTVKQILHGKNKPTIHLSNVADFDSLKMIKDAMDAVLRYQLEVKKEEDRKTILHHLAEEMGDSVDGQKFLGILQKYFNVIIKK
jgi:hypothetical protein